VIQDAAKPWRVVIDDAARPSPEDIQLGKTSSLRDRGSCNDLLTTPIACPSSSTTGIG
jgi:hypothetical protein